MLIYRILTAKKLNLKHLGVRFWAVLPACLAIAIMGNPGMAVSETVDLPLTIDYPLLRSLVVATVFTDPNETTTVLDENGGCRRITLSSPQYGSEDPHLLFEVKADIRLGTFIDSACLAPVEGEGFVVFRQRPRIEPQSWQ